MNLHMLKAEIMRRSNSEETAIRFILDLRQNGFASFPLLVPQRRPDFIFN